MMLDLSESQTWAADVGRDGIQVRVRSGEVWITRQRDGQDHVVRAAQAFESSWKGRLVVFALTPARLEVVPLAQPATISSRFAHAAAR
ncbi:MAG: DUF2917 domain-containing protein [Anaeromyxobacter sp.]